MSPNQSSKDIADVKWESFLFSLILNLSKPLVLQYWSVVTIFTMSPQISKCKGFNKYGINKNLAFWPWKQFTNVRQYGMITEFMMSQTLKKSDTHIYNFHRKVGESRILSHLKENKSVLGLYHKNLLCNEDFHKYCYGYVDVLKYLQPGVSKNDQRCLISYCRYFQKYEYVSQIQDVDFLSLRQIRMKILKNNWYHLANISRKW